MRRPQLILFFLLIVFLPTQVGYHFWPSFSLVNGVRVDYLSPTLYFTDILLVLLLLIWIKNEKPFLKLKIGKRSLASLIFFVTFIVFNVYLSSSPPLVLYKWVKLLEIGLLVVWIRDHKEFALKAMHWGLPVAISWTSALALAQWIKGGSLNGIFYWLGERSFSITTPGISLTKIFDSVSLRPYATLPHPNALAGFLLVSWLLWIRKEKLGKLQVFISMLVLFVIFLTESYSAWLALLCVGLLFISNKIKYKVSKRAWRFFVAQVFILSLASPYFLLRLDNNANVFLSNTRERMELTYLSGFVIQRAPVFGSGLGNFTRQIPLFTDKLPDIYRLRATSWLQPVHNAPLLIFAETGLSGLTIFFVGTVAFPFSFVWLSIVLISLFDHYWLTLQATSILLAIALSVLWKERKI